MLLRVYYHLIDEKSTGTGPADFSNARYSYSCRFSGCFNGKLWEKFLQLQPVQPSRLQSLDGESGGTSARRRPAQGGGEPSQELILASKAQFSILILEAMLFPWSINDSSTVLWKYISSLIYFTSVWLLKTQKNIMLYVIMIQLSCLSDSRENPPTKPSESPKLDWFPFPKLETHHGMIGSPSPKPETHHGMTIQ